MLIHMNSAAHETVIIPAGCAASCSRGSRSLAATRGTEGRESQHGPVKSFADILIRRFPYRSEFRMHALYSIIPEFHGLYRRAQICFLLLLNNDFNSRSSMAFHPLRSLAFNGIHIITYSVAVVYIKSKYDLYIDIDIIHISYIYIRIYIYYHMTGQIKIILIFPAFLHWLSLTNPTAAVPAE